MLGALLLASLGANVYLVFSSTSKPPPPEREGAGDRASSTASGAGSAPTAPECPPRPGARETAEMFGRLLAMRQLASGATPGEPTDRDGLRDIQDERARREALSLVGQVAAKQDWNEKRDELVESVLDSLADDERQLRDADGDARRFADALELTESEHELLERRYREPRLARMEELEQALDEDEPDYGAAFEALRGLYADEDALIEELFGADARDRLHDYEIDKRATILAIAATYAGLDWQQAIVW